MNMGRRRKNRRGDEQPEPGSKPAPPTTTSLGTLFKAAGFGKVAPASPRTLPPPGPESLVPVRAPAPAVVRPQPKLSPAAELRMLNDAYAGARPLTQKPTRTSAPPRAPIAREADEATRADEIAARARLAALVSGGVHFKVTREDDYVQGWRADASPKLVTRISGKGFVPDATLDLHGERVAKVADRVASFARTHHRKGARQLLIIAGKGLHSQDGVGVLRDALIEALTHGLAAPLVMAFATAHANQGGTGAVAVLLA
jgi:DNA-nicking Smr family endonuclease